MRNEFRMFTRRLKANGYTLNRVNGSHYIYVNSNGNTIAVNKDLNKMVQRRLIKENCLR